MRKINFLLFILAFVLVLASCNVSKKKNSSDKECLIEETITIGSASTGGIKYSEYAKYTFTPKENGFYNCVCSTQYFDSTDKEIANNNKPYQLCVGSKIILPCLRVNAESNTYYLKKDENYTLKINYVNNIDSFERMTYKMMLSSAKFDVDSLITKTSSSAEYSQILVLDEPVAGDYTVTNISTVSKYYLYDISDINMTNIKKYESYPSALGDNHIWASGDVNTFKLSAGKKYAFVLNWQLGNSLNQIVKPSLQKVELS